MKWWKKMSGQEKVMLIIIVMLVAGIILRWGYVRKEAGDAFKNRIERVKSDHRNK